MSTFWTSICLGACWLPAALLGLAPVSGGKPMPQVREDLREYFVLTDPDSADPVGIMALRRTAVVGGVLLEQDLIFPDGVRVFESERWRGNQRRFIRREWGHPVQGGQTWILEGRQGAQSLDLLSWGGGPAQRASLPVSDTTLFPMQMLEHLRDARDPIRDCVVVLPQQMGVESVVLEAESIRRSDGSARDSLRVVSMVNDHESTIGVWTFKGTQLVERQWPSGRSARAVSEQRYQTLSAAWSEKVRRSGQRPN